MTSCSFPNGCIPCAHKGAAICLLHSILHFCEKYKDRQNRDIDNKNNNREHGIPLFEEIEMHFPPPVHELLKIPQIMHGPHQVEFNLEENESTHAVVDNSQNKINNSEPDTQRAIPNRLEDNEIEQANIESEIEAKDEIADLRDHMEEQRAIVIPCTNIMDNSVQPNKNGVKLL